MVSLKIDKQLQTISFSLSIANLIVGVILPNIFYTNFKIDNQLQTTFLLSLPIADLIIGVILVNIFSTNVMIRIFFMFFIPHYYAR